MVYQYLAKLALCTAVGVVLSPYYWYSSNYTISYDFFNKRPALVESVKQEPTKQKKQDLESKFNPEITTEKPEENYYTSPKENLKNDTPVIKADKNYKLIDDKDFIIWRALGYVGSLPFKAFFMDWDVNNYVKPDTKNSIKTLLENDSKIDGLTVRLNHTSPFTDVYRLFTEEQLTERNNIFARFFLGMPTVLFGEFFSKFTRSDYYNPYTKTAVVYSNVEGVAKHEIGHHRDFTRFDRDWIYSLSRLLPPVMLYQEWKASKYAKWTLEEKNRAQFGRYLIPAYLTYLISTILGFARLYNWVKKELE